MTVLLAGGVPPSHDIPLGIFREADRLVACDGAWHSAIDLGRCPDAVVGDGDSIGPEARAELVRLGVPLVVSTDQDTNDLCKAFRYVVDSFPESGEISILGATGLREDHSIGNVFHLTDFAEEFRLRHGDGAWTRVKMFTDFGTFEPFLPPGHKWAVEPGHPVSVFATAPDTKMESEGLEWPLDGVTFDAIWRGTLNRAASQTFAIRTNQPAIVYLPYTP